MAAPARIRLDQLHFTSATLGEHFPRTLKVSFASKEKTEEAASRFFAGDLAQFGIVKMARAGLKAVFTFETDALCADFWTGVEELTGKLYLNSFQRVSLFLANEGKISAPRYRIQFDSEDGVRDFASREWPELSRRAEIRKEALHAVVIPRNALEASQVGAALESIFDTKILNFGEEPILSPTPLRPQKLIREPVARPHVPSPGESQKSGPKK